ncbi:MAG: hypothetical protein ACRDRD_16640 [Pseudonocardiaceae bacterium]
MSDPVRTSDDPQPEDLDALLETLDPRLIEDNPGGQRVRGRIVVDLDGDDAERLSRIAISRGEGAREVISSLLRDADRPAV